MARIKLGRVAAPPLKLVNLTPADKVDFKEVVEDVGISDTAVVVTANAEGAVPRNLNDKMSDQVSVNDFVGGVGGLREAVTASPSNIPKGVYNIDGFVKVDTNTTTALTGEGLSSEIIKTTPTSPSVFQIQNTRQAKLKDFKITLQGQTLTSSGSVIALIDADNAIIDGLTIEGFAGLGSIVQAYTTAASVAYHQVIKNSIGKGVRADSSNTNGFLITNGKFARLQDLYVKGVAAYGIEYKNLTQHSLMLNSIVEDSQIAFAYGQTTSDDTGVSYSLAANLISLNNGTAWSVGKGKYNLTSNVLVHNTVEGAFANKEGIRLNGTADYNSMCNFLFAGTLTSSVRLGSSYNYTSGTFYAPVGNIVYDLGAKGNVVEVQHSGDRATILSFTTDNSGSIGLDRNVTYSHGTGEYLGTRSGKWLWQHEASGISRGLSSSKWLFEGRGNSYLDIITDGIGGSGLIITSPTGTSAFQYIHLGNYWKINTLGGGGYRFHNNVIRAETDNFASLGSAAIRFSTIYAATGAISTSDEQLKTPLINLGDAEKRAAVKIKKSIGRYQFKEAVDKKGNKARYHFGVGAQTIAKIMRDEGLNPEQYAFYCYDEWDATDEKLDEDGNILETSQVAGNRYGIRYDELAMFILSTI